MPIPWDICEEIDKTLIHCPLKDSPFEAPRPCAINIVAQMIYPSFLGAGSS